MPAKDSSDSDTKAEQPDGKIMDKVLDLWHACMGYLGHQNVKMLTKMSKGINLIKVSKVKDSYKLYTIAKGKAGEYTSYICPGKRLLDLVHSDITGPFDCGRREGKYFITFLNDYNKYLEVEVLESKSDVYAAYLYYTARNERGDIKIRRFRTNYSGEYLDYNFDNLRANQGTI